MDFLDKKILNILQKEFPLAERPFQIVAEKCDISEDEAMYRIQKLKDNGIIRRIGAVFDGAKIGRVSTLCAARVSPDKLKKFIDEVIKGYEWPLDWIDVSLQKIANHTSQNMEFWLGLYFQIKNLEKSVKP